MSVTTSKPARSSGKASEGTLSGADLSADQTRTLAEPTVYVVDDDAAVCGVLRLLIESVGLRVETFARAREFLAAYRPDRPACLVLDVRMPEMSGLDLQDELATRKISIPIIVLTGYSEVSMAVRALKAGAFDFVEKPFSNEVLLGRIRCAIAENIAARKLQMEQLGTTSRLARLTPRQRQVLDHVIAGKPSKEIAAELGLSPKTVDVHRARIMETLEAQSLPHLFHLVLRASATSPSAIDSRASKPRPARAPQTRRQQGKRRRDA